MDGFRVSSNSSLIFIYLQFLNANPVRYRMFSQRVACHADKTPRPHITNSEYLTTQVFVVCDLDEETLEAAIAWSL